MSFTRRPTRSSSPQHGGRIVLHIVSRVEDPGSRGKRAVGVADSGHPVGDPDQIVVNEDGERAECGLHPGALKDLELRRHVHGLDFPDEEGRPGTDREGVGEPDRCERHEDHVDADVGLTAPE